MAGSKFLVPLEPNDLEWRFSSGSFIWPEVFFEGMPEHKRPQRVKVMEVIKKLPKREQDIVTLYYIVGKDQRDIGQILSITQGDVSYRLKRAIRRIKFLVELPDIDVEELRENLACVMPSEQYVDIMVGILETSSQTAVAKMCNLSQGKIRYRFLRGLEIVKDQAKDQPQFKVYQEVFEKIAGNFNIMRQLSTQLRWSKKFEDTLVA